jgi:hypothetical protein
MLEQKILYKYKVQLSDAFIYMLRVSVCYGFLYGDLSQLLSMYDDIDAE